MRIAISPRARCALQATEPAQIKVREHKFQVLATKYPTTGILAVLAPTLNGLWDEIGQVRGP